MGGRARRATTGVHGSPFLTNLRIDPGRAQRGVHPFDLPLFESGLDLAFTTPVTFVVGENGSGKSSLLEAIAWASGFGAQGGARDTS